MSFSSDVGSIYKMDLEDGYSPPPLEYIAAIREEHNEYWLGWLDLDTYCPFPD